jgi:hypothetical protein
MAKPRRKPMTRAPQIKGGALPGPGSLGAMGARLAGPVLREVLTKPIGGGGRMAQGGRAAQHVMNATVSSPANRTYQAAQNPAKATFRPSPAPKVPKPRDTSAKPVVSTYSHPAAKTRPSTTAHMKSPQKGRPGRGGARPI